MINTRPITLSFLLTCLSLSCGSSADDTEVFFSQSPTGNETSGQILFMFDTSGSMDATDGVGIKRIDRLKRAMLDLLDGGVSARIGVGAFNGQYRGGSILVPPVALGEDRCANGSCERVKVRSAIASSADDGIERADGTIELEERSLDMSQSLRGLDLETEYFELQKASDDAMHYPDGTFELDSPTLLAFGEDAGNPPVIGVRFDDVDLETGSHIVSADIAFAVPSDSMTRGTKHARIRVDGSEDSPTFSDDDGRRVLDRTYLPEIVEWRDIDRKYDEDSLVKTTDLSRLVQARIDQPNWEQKGAMSFLIEHAGDIPVGSGNRRGFKAFESDFADNAETRLKVVYSADPIPTQTVGMRFTNVNIPRGAIIQDASIAFTIDEESSSAANLEISAQATGDAEPFTTTSGNLSTRSRTTARVDWTPDAWTNDKWAASSTDIASLIQELVNRSDWCGGNAIALFVSGTGSRSAESYDKNPWTAPVLNVNYAPGSVDFNDTCLRQTTRTQISSPVDDAVESMGNGAMATNTATLQTRDASHANTLGLRFQGLNVPRGATIVDARLRLVSADGNGETAHLAIHGENSGYSAVFNTNFDHDLSLRVPTQATVAWNDIEQTTPGSGLTSPDVSAIVEEIVARSDWQAGNPLTLILEADDSVTGQRGFRTQEDDAPASLIVHYQLDATDLSGQPVPLKTGRDDLLSAILDMEPIGATPLVDAYYEAAAYLTGGAVEFGKQRGDGRYLDRFYHVSAADTYTGGEYYRPPLCQETDLHNEACVGERIDLSPIYNPDPPASCQADQIVLLSDGASTTNNARELVKTMTGVSDCASREVSHEECGLELSDWLSSTDHHDSIEGEQPIITHTVGFNFSSSFLAEVATTAGGGFHTASSSSELASVFSNIVRTTADVNTSFVAPATTVSQSNRLANSNELYFSLFHPRNSNRWDGNLKKYRFAQSDDTGEAVIVGVGGKEAFDSVNGTISNEVQSLWSDVIDGADITKGGASSQLDLSRDILTFTDETASPIVLESLHESNDRITTEMLNLDPSEPDRRLALLQWARGVDVKDHDQDGDSTEVRAQMGDPLHSQPSILDYPDRSLIFLATNEGFLHAIDTLTGTEEFAFIPKPLLANLDRFFADEPSTERIYGLDGPMTTWINDSNDNDVVEAELGETAYLVIGMRRGGRNYYALDVTNPDNPKLAWVIEGGTGHFAELGQTWSKPIRTRVKSSGTAREVLVFAAGYDVRNDDKVLRDKTDTMGRGLYIVDAHTGERLAYQAPIDQNDLAYSIPSTIRAIDINLDSFVDTLFVGDTGGQLWRFDIDNEADGSLEAAISGGVIADLSGSDGRHYRRFFNEPDIALISDPVQGEFLTIALGSGFRAHPRDTQVQDRFYVLRDTAVFGPPRDTSEQIAYSKIGSNDLFDATSESAQDSNSDDLAKGWFMNLVDAGEKSMSKAITVNQQILFTTYLPESGNVGVCDVSLGSGRVYAVDALYGGAVANLDDASDADSDEELTLKDRRRELKSPGIPPSVTALIPEASKDKPVLLAGPEQLPALDFGRLFQRTYWAAH